MRSGPRFRFFLYHPDHPVAEGDAEWTAFMPSTSGPEDNSAGAAVSYGDYFSAMRGFLEKHLADLLGRMTTAPVDTETIAAVHVTIEKHGAFYHPARIGVSTDTEAFSFVLNGAVSEIGRRWIENEYRCLTDLNRECGHCHLPKTYGFSYGPAINGEPVPFFVAQWMDGYCEFHWTRFPRECIMAWVPGEGRVPFSKDRVATLYRNAAGILADCYDLKTFKQILAWHHGAGDFIVRPKDLAVKLIAARKYEALLRHDAESPDMDTILAGVLMFLLTQTAWMRIDRLDGVGEMYWAGEEWVRPITEGILDALDRNRSVCAKGGLVSAHLRRFWEQWAADELADMADAALAAAFPGRPELKIIHHGLDAHVAALDVAIRGR